jgi:hypothetical protein
VPVQEEDRGQGLILRGRGDLALDGEVVQEREDLAGPHRVGVPQTMESDEPAHPRRVGRLLGAAAVVAHADGGREAVEELRGRRHGTSWGRCGMQRAR